MGINCLEKTKNDPEVHGENVKVAGDQDPGNWDSDCASAKDHGFNWGSVLSGQTERCRVLVVNFMDVLI